RCSSRRGCAGRSDPTALAIGAACVARPPPLVAARHCRLRHTALPLHGVTTGLLPDGQHGRAAARLRSHWRLFARLPARPGSRVPAPVLVFGWTRALCAVARRLGKRPAGTTDAPLSPAMAPASRC